MHRNKNRDPLPFMKADLTERQQMGNTAYILAREITQLTERMNGVHYARGKEEAKALWQRLYDERREKILALETLRGEARKKAYI